MSGGGSGPLYVEGRVGLGGFASLYAEAFGRLRSSAHLRASYLFWIALGLVFTEAFSVSVAHLQSTDTERWAAAAALGWWLFPSLVLAGGVALLRTPAGDRIDHIGVPNGLTALRAYSCLPLLLTATLSTPGRSGFVIWSTTGGLIGLLDFADGFIARRVGPLTELGRALDPAMDSLFFGTAAIGSTLLGIIPRWLMALLLFRYLAPLLATPIVFLARRRPELVYTVWGRRNTALTGVVFFVLMLVRAFYGPVDAVAIALGVPLLATTTVLHFVALAERTYHAPVVRERRRPG
jgi:phosphatidylglycerophosphate synthase